MSYESHRHDLFIDLDSQNGFSVTTTFQTINSHNGYFEMTRI